MRGLERLTSSMINAVDGLMMRYSSLVKSSITDYCGLDMAIDEYTLATKEFALLSYIDIQGAATLRGDDEFIEAMSRLELLYNNLLEKPAHSLQWVVARNPSQTGSLIEKYFSPLRNSAKSQQLDDGIVAKLLNERSNVLRKYISDERCLLVLKTNLEALDVAGRNAQVEDKINSPIKKKLKEEGLPENCGRMAQKTHLCMNRLMLVHKAATKTLLEQLTGEGVSLYAKLLSAHEAVQAIRTLHHPTETSPDWRPVLHGDPIPYRSKPTLAGESDNSFYPVISSQIFRRKVEPDGDVLKSGSDYYATTMIELTPQEPRRFETLFKALPNTTDWRFSLTFLGGDVRYSQKIKSRQAMAKIFRITNSKHNEPIIDGCEELLSIRRAGESLVGVRVQLSVREKSKEAASESIQVCARVLQAWGNSETSFERGDPTDALISTLPGLDTQNTGTTLIQPVRDSAIYCPISRPVSPWNEFGTNLYRTKDGKLYPVQMCSSEQVAWIDLIFAKPGSGKSVLLNSQNLNLCLTPGLSRLPKVSVLDIGPSSLGLIQLLQESLPPSRRGEVVHKVLKQDKSSAINPFDTPLGMRFPHSSKESFLKSFLLLLFTEDGQKNVKAGIGELVTMLIRQVYKYYSDEYSPKTYAPHIEPRIDVIIKDNPDWFYGDEDVPAKRKKRLTWWNIVDILSTKSCFKEAAIAQQQAVPLLMDLTQVLHGDQAIKEIYGKTNKGAENIDHLIMMIRSAISEHIILGHPTQFNLGEARVVALDLADVTGGGSDYALKKSGLMYMLGREVLLGSFYFNEDDITHLPKLYKDYHVREINKSLGEIKRICCDEYHRTASLEAVRAQMELDLREGRKYKVAFSLASQRHHDFTKAMVELATNIYICNGAQGTVLKEIAQTFDLSLSEQDALKYEVHGAGRGGASFLFKSETKSGWVTQVLVNTLGILELWALASTAEDSLMRKTLAEDIPYFKVLELLAQKFPSGTAKDSIFEKVRRTGHTAERVMDEMIEDMKNIYKTTMMNNFK